MRSTVLAFLGGALVLQTFATLPSMWWPLALLPAALLIWLAARKWPRLGYGLLLVWACLAGLCYTAWRADLLLREALPAALEGRDLWVEGHVADLPQPAERGLRFRFDVEQARLDMQAVRVPRRIQLSVYGDGPGLNLPLRVGDRWRLLVRLKRPHGFQNPSGFDYEAYLLRERVRATGYVRSRQPAVLLASDPFSYPLGRLRQQIGARVQAALPDNPFAGMVTAFINGDETGIRDAQWEVLQRTGTGHLVAISGMNIGFIAGLMFFLVRRAWAWLGNAALCWPAPKAAAVGALLAATVYAALAGFAIPTQRALIMLAVVMGGVLLQRRTAPSHLLALALWGVLLYDPLAVLAAGFWLSFASVAAIVFAMAGRRDARQWWRLLSNTQWAVTIGLLPLLLVLFQQVSLVGPVANLLAVPVIELLVIPLSLLGTALLALLPALAALCLQGAAWTLQTLWPVLTWLAAWDYAQWTQPRPPAWAVIGACVGVLWLLAPRGWPARWVGAVWLLPLLSVRPPVPPPGEVWLTLLDVGQGLSAVIRTHAHTLVYDAGPYYSARFDAGRSVVAPYLRGLGVRRIDTLIVSHGDNDHRGGARSLLRAFAAERIFTSIPESFAGAQYCKQGQSWRWDGVEFHILSPESESGRRGNNACCVLWIASAHGNILLPGDIEAQVERALVRRWGERLAAQVLIAPHHGSKSSSSAAFVAHVRPQVVLFPVGYRNAYHHPHHQVVQRYASTSTRLYDSAAHGAVEIALAAGGLQVSPYRQSAKRYWFTPHAFDPAAAP